MIMPFPLPLDPDHRLEVIKMWLDDVDDRLEIGAEEDAALSYAIARNIYLKLPGGFYDQDLEDRMISTQGKMNQTHSTNQ